MVYFILLAYLGITFLGSLIGTRKLTNTPEGYFLANRNLNTVTLFFTILATNFSAFYFLGFAGEGYRTGYPYYVIMALGTSFACLSFFIIGTKAWSLGKKHGYITPSELVYDRTGSNTLRLLFAIIMLLFTFPYLALQIVGAGYILENITGGEVSYFMGAAMLTAFTIVYTFIGGMTSVARTDMKQGLLMVLMMGAAVWVITDDLGGLKSASQQVFDLHPELFSREGKGGHYHPQRWFSWLIFWIFAIPMFPQIFMRFYVARDLKHLKRSAILYAFIPLIISLLPVIIGVLGHISFPGLEGKSADQILPMMLVKHAPDWFGALVMTGALAAFMSTLDSQLLALSTITTRDFHVAFTNKKPSLRTQVWWGRVWVIVFAITGLAIASNPFETIFDMGKLAFSGLSILFPVAFAVLWKKNLNRFAAILSILAGELTLLGFHYKLIPNYWTFGFESFIPAIAISFVVLFSGYYIGTVNPVYSRNSQK